MFLCGSNTDERNKKNLIKLKWESKHSVMERYSSHDIIM